MRMKVLQKVAMRRLGVSGPTQVWHGTFCSRHAGHLTSSRVLYVGASHRF